jgi:hypothetical protein
MNEQLNFQPAGIRVVVRQFSSSHICVANVASELRENHWGILNNFYVPSTIYAFYYVRNYLTYTVSVCDNILRTIWICIEYTRNNFQARFRIQSIFFFKTLTSPQHFSIFCALNFFCRCKTFYCPIIFTPNHSYKKIPSVKENLLFQVIPTLFPDDKLWNCVRKQIWKCSANDWMTSKKKEKKQIKKRGIYVCWPVLGVYMMIRVLTDFLLFLSSLVIED